jgi:hypothetical protein
MSDIEKLRQRVQKAGQDIRHLGNRNLQAKDRLAELADKFEADLYHIYQQSKQFEGRLQALAEDNQQLRELLSSLLGTVDSCLTNDFGDTSEALEQRIAALAQTPVMAEFADTENDLMPNAGDSGNDSPLPDDMVTMEEDLDDVPPPRYLSETTAEPAGDEEDDTISMMANLKRLLREMTDDDSKDDDNDDLESRTVAH